MSKRHPTVLCKKPGSMVLRSLLALAMFGPMGLRADEQESGRPVSSNQPVSSVSGVSNDESKPAKKERHFLIVPIPVVDPTFGTGLIVGAAYFYKQTEEQKKAQPASFTGAAAAYTNTNSWAAGVMQQNYWSEDRWRFTGVAGYLDFKLDLPLPIGSGSRSLNWDVKGDAVQTTISRKIAGPWYVGAQARYLDIIQNLGVTGELSGFSLDPEITSVGLAALVERDTREGLRMRTTVLGSI